MIQTRQPIEKLSIVIPVARGDLSWVSLLDNLRQILPWGTEVLLVGPTQGWATDAQRNFKEFAESRWSRNADVRWIETDIQNRAVQMNQAARLALGEYLFFLHSDSVLTLDCLKELDRSLTRDGRFLRYFRLKFVGERPRMMKCNEVGVDFRSRFLGVPFGDQGFCLKKEDFFSLGGFDESLKFGEDHVFVWKARQKGFKGILLNNRIGTSARKYQQKGWGRVTLKHLSLTAYQAFPQWLKLQKVRFKRAFTKKDSHE